MWGYRGYYYDRCRDRLAATNIVPSGLRASVCENVALRVSELAQRSQVFDFHCWREMHGYRADVESHSALDQYKSSWENAAKYVDYLNEKYPLLGSFSKRIMEGTTSFAEEVFRHWSDDQIKLEKDGLIPSECEIANWKFLFEETHRGGKGALLVEWCNEESRGTLVYKPRTADGEQLIGSVFSLVADEECEKCVPAALTIGQHSWHEFVPREPISDPESYFRRCGKLLAVCSLLGTTDLHADNVRPGPNGCPIIVDAETAIQLRPVTDNPIGIWELFSSGLIPTTLGAPLLAAYGGLAGAQGFGLNHEQAFVSFELSDPDTDAVSVKRTTGRLSVPSLGGTQHSISARVRQTMLIEGFMFALNRLKNTDKLDQVIEANTLGKTFRQVVRGTNVYAALQTAAADPLCLSGKQPLPFRLLIPKDLKSRSITSVVVESEMQQLSEGDVPYFSLCFTEKGGCYLSDGMGLNIKADLIEDRKVLNLYDRINWIMQLQKEQIRSALNINDCTLGVQTSSPRIRDLERFLSDVKADDVPQWMWVDSTSPEELRLVSGGISMLGSLGTACVTNNASKSLSLAKKQATSAKLRWFTWGPLVAECLVNGFTEENYRVLREDLCELIQEQSMGDYLTGLLGLLAHIPENWNSSELEGLLSRAKVEDNDSLAHGKAGLLAAALGVQHKIADELGAQLSERLIVAQSFDELAWCRGTTGTVVTLAAGGFLTKTQADSYVDSVNRVFAEKIKNEGEIDLSFCHGLAGIVGSLDLLQRCGHHLAGVCAARLRRLMDYRLEQGKGYYLAQTDVKEDPGFLNGYGSLFALRSNKGLHPLLPPIRKGVSNALG